MSRREGIMLKSNRGTLMVEKTMTSSGYVIVTHQLGGVQAIYREVIAETHEEAEALYLSEVHRAVDLTLTKEKSGTQAS